MKMLMITPIMYGLGGVSNHIAGLAPHWSIDVQYLTYGRRRDKMAKILVAFFYIHDYFLFIFKCIFSRFDFIFINPSLRKFQITRDCLFIWLAKLFNKKVVVMFHGFDEIYAQSLKGNKFYINSLNYATYIYVLYSKYKETLCNIGIKTPILLTTTKVSDELVNNYSFQRNGQIRKILFVARIVKSKGIYTTLDTFAILKNKYSFLKLIICGDGPELSAVKKYAKEKGIKDIEFKGNVRGLDIGKYYSEGDVYILPTHFEGMATSVLEAMAFGLPVISRPVGGVNDFFINGKMGYLLDTFEPEEYAKVIDMLIHSPELVMSISQNNETYAREHFLASSVCEKIERDLYKYIGNKR